MTRRAAHLGIPGGPSSMGAPVSAPPTGYLAGLRPIAAQCESRTPLRCRIVAGVVLRRRLDPEAQGCALAHVPPFVHWTRGYDGLPELAGDRHCIARLCRQEWRMPETEPDRSLRILIVDDHDIVRQGIAALLERQPGYDVVAQAGTAADAMAAVDRFAPDLIILDVGLPDGSGIETCREIKARRPETRVVILTGSADEDTVLTAVVAGANGYLLKSSGVREVMHAIDVVAAGGSLLDPVATDRMVRRIRRLGEGTEADPLVALAARERRILELIAAGLTNKEIAAEISLSEKTVKRSVSVILSKLNLERRAQAAALYAGRRPTE